MRPGLLDCTSGLSTESDHRLYPLQGHNCKKGAFVQYFRMNVARRSERHLLGPSLVRGEKLIRRFEKFYGSSNKDGPMSFQVC
jgi:hypothetical protein